jgi:hypothetical protein
VTLERIGNRIDHLPVGKHAQLNRADVKIIEACIDLYVALPYDD